MFDFAVRDVLVTYSSHDERCLLYYDKIETDLSGCSSLIPSHQLRDSDRHELPVRVRAAQATRLISSHVSKPSLEVHLVVHGLRTACPL